MNLKILERRRKKEKSERRRGKTKRIFLSIIIYDLKINSRKATTLINFKMINK